MDTNNMEVVVTTFERNRSLQMVFSVLAEYDKSSNETPPFNVGGMALVVFEFKKDHSLETQVKVRKHDSVKDQNVLVTIKNHCDEIEFICTDEWSSYKLLGKYTCISAFRCIKLFILNVTVMSTTVKTPEFKALYEDKYTDFSLGTEDCSVPVHKAILAVTSDVFKSMLTREWTETIRGTLNIEGLTAQTYEQLKKYMYYGALPDYEDLERLMLVGNCYMINPLVEASSHKLALTVTGDRLLKLIQFAIDHRMMRLLYTIIQLTPANIVQAGWEAKKGQIIHKPEKAT